MHTIASYTVTYNRADRCWETANGRILATFPAGRDGEQAAVDRAILEADPALHTLLHRLVGHAPELQARAYRAAELVLNDQVRPPTPGVPDAVADVGSQSQPGKVYTLQQRECVVCPCDDYQETHAARVPRRLIGGVEQKLCKHILALSLAAQSERIEVAP